MHSREGCFVSGHYRNGSWVEGHYRSGSNVDDNFIPAPIIKSNKLIKQNIEYRNITFFTNCWWCGDEVYFHRNKNGGCVLLNHLGHPWPIHPCWSENIEDREAAIRFFTMPEQRKIQLPKFHNTIDSDLLPSSISGCLITEQYNKQVIIDKYHFFEVMINGDNNQRYKLLLPFDLYDFSLNHQHLTFTGEWYLRGKGSVFFCKHISFHDYSGENGYLENQYVISDKINISWTFRDNT